jgi:hypothetical protein
MADPFSFEELVAGDLTAALSALDDEQRKMREFQQAVAEASTTVRSKDRMLSATFDGRGELTELKFHSTRYREMAPAELANAVVQILAEGRGNALAAMAGLSGAPKIPGVDFAELASGKVDLDQVMGAVLGPLFGGKPAEQNKTTEG